MRRSTSVWGLSLLLLGACDAPGDEVEAPGEAPGEAPDEASEGQRPPSEHALRGGVQDPEEAGLLCLICYLGGNHPVCGADNATYNNECFAVCDGVAVVHTGVCKCGDGFAGAGEGCDDGNLANNDACLANCTPATCGDGHLWVGHEGCDDGNSLTTDACIGCVPASCSDGHVWAGQEGCDDGNANDGDACPRTCEPARCGDGIVEVGVEGCDDGNPYDTDACLRTCTLAACGDGHVRAGVEACDDGNTNNGDACLSTCTTAQCGDGAVHAGVEACDDGNPSNADGCLSTCLVASCGDGFVHAGVEDCDDGNISDADGCLSTCEVASCGDGHMQAGVEACDDGNASDADGCLSSCEVATCGDGHLQAGVEGCDDGDLDNTDGCIATCQPASCGDGFVHAGVEGCDDNNLANNDSCLATCQPASCGDGIRWFGVEACDDGNPADNDACRADCSESFCGDGVVWLGVESCDDGNADDSDGCLSTCWPATCGDGFVLAGVETCDDGDNDDFDNCPGNCQTATCGDGFLEFGVEDCDDGDLDPTNACTDLCEAATCGDGAVHAGVEQCDDGDLVSGDGCSSTCELEICGDGIVAVGEDCDDGNGIEDACTNTCTAGPKVLGVKLGILHVCARLTGNRVKCWGRNTYGELGLGDTENRGDEPDEMGAALPFVDFGTDVPIALGLGYYQTCAVLADHTVRCFGTNKDGSLGQGHSQDIGTGPDAAATMPRVNLGIGAQVAALAVNDTHSCVVLATGQVKCWGSNAYGMLGFSNGLYNGDKIGDDPGEMGDALPALDLGAGKHAVSVAVGAFHTCANFSDMTVKCWGRNDFGQLGLGDVADRLALGDAHPTVDVGTGAKVVQMALGQRHTCARLDDGRVKCWGFNSGGVLGLGDIEYRGDEPGEMGDTLPFVNLGTGRTATIIVAGFDSTCAILDNGSLKCWGLNLYGKLGLGDTKSRGHLPGEMGDGLPAVDLGTGRTAVSVAMAPTIGGTCAMLDDGSLKCWGLNKEGELGLGDLENRGDEPGEMGDALPRVKLFSSVW